RVSEDLPRAGSDLKVALGRLVRRMRQRHEPGELTLSEATVLARLDREGPATPGALADAERVRPQAMGTTLATLEHRGVVDRAHDPADGRRSLMSITAEGGRILHNHRARNVDALTRAISEGLTLAEQEQLIAAIPLLEKLADQI